PREGTTQLESIVRTHAPEQLLITATNSLASSPGVPGWARRVLQSSPADARKLAVDAALHRLLSTPDGRFDTEAIGSLADSLQVGRCLSLWLDMTSQEPSPGNSYNLRSALTSTPLDHLLAAVIDIAHSASYDVASALAELVHDAVAHR